MRAATTGLGTALGTGATSVIRGRRRARGLRGACPAEGVAPDGRVLAGGSFARLRAPHVGRCVSAVRGLQAQWKFSAATLTAVFAIYAIFLLVTLLLFGSVADYLGRRPVILAALAITAIACALFLA